MKSSGFEWHSLRLAILGNLCDNGVIFARFLRAPDIQPTVYMSCDELQACTIPELQESADMEMSERVRYLHKNAELRVRVWDYAPKIVWLHRLPLGNHLFTILVLCRFLRWLQCEDAVFSVAMYHIVSWLSRRPYIAFSTGADLHEMAVSPTVKGWLMRRAFRGAVAVKGSFDSLSRENATRIRIGEMDIFLIPWAVPERPVPPLTLSGPIRVFMPSQQDWCDHSRAGIGKRNDLFIKAWARRVKEGWDSQLTIVAHGMDIEATRRLVDELEMGERVDFVPRLGQKALQEQIERADLVADQFDQGTPGALSLQALAAGRGLAIYWDEINSSFAYSCVPPIINGNCEEEIYRNLKENDTREALQELGRRGHAWMKCEYNQVRLRRKLRFSLSTATGVPLVIE